MALHLNDGCRYFQMRMAENLSKRSHQSLTAFSWKKNRDGNIFEWWFKRDFKLWEKKGRQCFRLMVEGSNFLKRSQQTLERKDQRLLNGILSYERRRDGNTFDWWLKKLIRWDEKVSFSRKTERDGNRFEWC